MLNEERKNILRERLESLDDDLFQKELYEEFIRAEQIAHQLWVPLLGHDKGSLSGPAHLANVESQACTIISKTKEAHLSSVEVFVLLCSILYHDFGKVYEKTSKNDSENQSKLIKLLDEVEKEKHHACLSAIGLISNHRELGFSDFQIVECIAIVCATHYLPAAKKLKKEGCLEDIYLDHYGLIRLNWLCAILVFADEMDNSFHRAACEWVKSDIKDKRNLRVKLNGCEMDERGKQLIIHLGSNYFESLFNNKVALNHIKLDIDNKNELLSFWHNPLRQMNLELLDVSINYKGHLLKFSSGLAESVSLKPMVEPCIRQIKVDRIVDSALSLRLNSFGRTTFPWEALACEAGFEKVGEAKLIFHRLSMLAKLFFAYATKNNATYVDLIYKCTAGSMEIDFIELDGEWTIDIGLKYKDSLLKFYDWIKRVISFSNNGSWPEKEIKETRNDQLNYHIKNKNLAYLLDENTFYRDKEYSAGILFTNKPEDNYIYPDNRGLNLVICGPPGVGKTTFAMELLNQGILKNGNENVSSLFAYCSLEQQNDPIKNMAYDIDIIDNPVEKKESQKYTVGMQLRTPNFLRLYSDIGKKDNGNDRRLIFPSLVPNIITPEGKHQDIFWYRYKQILRLIEGDRCLSMKSNKDHYRLAVIVIDSINGFTQEKLHRSDIHRLFKLITWSGLLGIHILENPPDLPVENLQGEIEYLADIVIKLDWIRDEYQYKVMEILKSRNQRHVLGQHPFKIRRIGKFSNIEFYPSIHTLVSRNEKSVSINKKSNIEDSVTFSYNKDLNYIIQKNESSTGIRSNAFIVLRGETGGHKLAIGMSYIHKLIKKDTSNKIINVGLIINLGQTINYDNVAESELWKGSNNEMISGLKSNISANISAKFSIDCYFSYEKKGNTIINKRIIYIINFHPGFLLPEEFLYIISSVVDQIQSKEILKSATISKKWFKYFSENLNETIIKRALFNSTGHLPEQFPLLDKNTLFLHALTRFFKRKDIGLMIIAVERLERDQQIESLSVTADLKVNIYRKTTENILEILKRNKIEPKSINSNVRIISSDNVTGKDYSKRYGLLYVDDVKNLKVIKFKEDMDKFVNGCN